MGTVSPFPQSLYTNNPNDVNLGQGLATVYDFVPDKSGNYKLFTGPFGGFGGSNDTVLEIYSDPNLTNLIGYNDDANVSTVFSEIRTSLISGFHYYVKIHPYSSSGSVFARLTAQLDSPQITVIPANTPVDVDAYAGESKVFQFNPSAFGYYKVITDYYGGTSSSGPSDTVLFTYSDPNLTTLTSYNDDSMESLFSEISIGTGSTFFFKVAGYNGGSIHTRVMVIPISNPIIKPTLTINNPVDVSTTPGDSGYFTFTPDTTGLYRFYTSPYQGTGSVNDTVLYLYDPSGHLIARNDDSLGQSGKGFSMFESTLTAGSNYVVMVKNYSRTGSVNARLTVQGADIHGFLTWPVPSSKQITLPYGRIDYIESIKYHSGIDIQGKTGAEIKSAANGQVVYAGNNGDYGNVVYINSLVEGKQTQIRYAHLQDISVAVGSVVSQGDLIGHMGSTGNTLGGSVLYFAVLESTDGSPGRIDDTNLVLKNPLDYFDTITEGNVDYLSFPFAIGRTPLDTTTRNTALISSIRDDDVGISYIPDDPEDRFLNNLDLSSNESYLVKIARDYARIAGVKDDTEFFTKILYWDEEKRTIEVNLNSKTRVYTIDETKADSSIPIVLLSVSNDHAKINTDDFIKFFYSDDSEPLPPNAVKIKRYLTDLGFENRWGSIDFIGDNILRVKCNIVNDYTGTTFEMVEVDLPMYQTPNGYYADPVKIIASLAKYFYQKTDRGIYARQWSAEAYGILYNVNGIDQYDVFGGEDGPIDITTFINQIGPQWEVAYMAYSNEDRLNDLQQGLDLISCFPVIFIPAQGGNILISFARGDTKDALIRMGLLAAVPIATKVVSTAVSGTLKTAVENAVTDTVLMKSIVEAVTVSVSKIKTAADDFLNYASGKIVKLRDGIGFRPAVAGVDNSEELLTVLNSSEISNMSKIESIAGAAGRYLSIDEIAPDIANLVKKVRFRGTVLDMMDESGNVLRRVVVPEGYRSAQQLLYKAITGEVDLTRWGYTNTEKMEEAVNNVNRYLNRSDLNRAPGLINSKLAGKIVDFGDGIVVEFDPIGFPIFKGSQLITEVSILDDAVVMEKGLGNMTGTAHMEAATRKFKGLMEQEANSAGETLDNYLGSKGFNDGQIVGIIGESSNIEGYIWHHHQETGRMQLVVRETHEAARHNGGDSLWGSGMTDE